MRALPSTIAIFVCVVAVTTAVASAPLLPSRALLAPTPDIVRVDARCGRSWHWVPPGYAKHGKWRDGHCSPN
jgi:hypothetical protein